MPSSRTARAVLGALVLAAALLAVVFALTSGWGSEPAGQRLQGDDSRSSASDEAGLCGGEPCPRKEPADTDTDANAQDPPADESVGDAQAEEEGPCGAEPCPPADEAADEGPCGPEPCPPPGKVEGEGPCGDEPCPPPGEVEGEGPCGAEPCASAGHADDE